MSNELGILSGGIRLVTGNNTMEFNPKSCVSTSEKVVYTNIVYGV